MPGIFMNSHSLLRLAVSMGGGPTVLTLDLFLVYALSSCYFLLAMLSEQSRVPSPFRKLFLFRLLERRFA